MPPHKDREKEEAKTGTTASGATSGDPGSADAPPAGEASLAEQLQKLLAEKQDVIDTLVRRQADFENYRKRVEREREQDRHRGVELLIEQLLPVLDAFDRALAAHDNPAYEEYSKGFQLIQRQLWDALSKLGLERIESVGKEFNPHYHHAIESVETKDHPEGTVIGELQPGYVFRNRVLRPAMVRVAAESASKSAQASRREN